MGVTIRRKTAGDGSREEASCSFRREQGASLSDSNRHKQGVSHSPYASLKRLTPYRKTSVKVEERLLLALTATSANCYVSLLLRQGEKGSLPDGLLDACRCAEEVIPSAFFQRIESVTRVPRLITAIATGNGGRVCAFVTFTPIYGSQVSQPEHVRWGWALDLMRRTPDAPPGIIELLLVRSIERFRSKGAQVVSLGMVAMADTRQEMTASQKQLANFAFEHLRFLETHRSLLRFKQKFQPCWESRYLAVSTTLALPKIALALLRVHQR